MRRVMVAAWGPDASQYVGRSMTLYRDPKVQFGGMQVGGIRISHMTHIERDMTMALTATRAKRAPYTVKVLQNAPRQGQQQKQTPEQWLEGYLREVAAAETLDALAEVQQRATKALDKLRDAHPDLHRCAVEAGTARAEALNPSEGRSDEQHGEAFTGAEDDPF